MFSFLVIFKKFWKMRGAEKLIVMAYSNRLLLLRNSNKKVIAKLLLGFRFSK